MTLSTPPQFDSAAYRRALGAFATGVCVVTAETEGGGLGITINSFTSVSLNPHLILWCLDEHSQRRDVFASADQFSLHVLGADDRDLAARFARSACALERGEYEVGPFGGPRLKNVLTRLDCRAVRRLLLGDHLAIVGEVEAFEAQDGDGLAFFRGHYGRIGEGRA